MPFGAVGKFFGGAAKKAASVFSGPSQAGSIPGLGALQNILSSISSATGSVSTAGGDVQSIMDLFRSPLDRDWETRSLLS